MLDINGFSERIEEAKKKILVIDPSINILNDIQELIIQYRIKIITVSDNDALLMRLYKILVYYFSDKIIQEIFHDVIDKDVLRNLKINSLMD